MCNYATNGLFSVNRVQLCSICSVDYSRQSDTPITLQIYDYNYARVPAITYARVVNTFRNRNSIAVNVQETSTYSGLKTA